MNRKLANILCIDDDKHILSVLRICLQNVGGYNVTTCLSGAESLAHIKTEKPDIILLDVMMPGQSGVALAKAIHEAKDCRTIPIIFMTARVQPRDIEDYLENGACAVIAKPFDPITLSDQIAEIWSQYHVE